MTITVELSMVESGSLITSRTRLLKRVVPTKPNLPPICVQFSGPSACLPAARDPFDAGRVIAAETCVHQVLGDASRPQVAPSVVTGVAVDMINIAITPRTSHHRICNAMGCHSNKIDAQKAVTADGNPACNFPRLLLKYLPVRQNSQAPADIARLGLVRKKLPKSLDRGQLVRFPDVSHFALLRRFWLGPRIGVGAPTRPAFLAKFARFFNVQGATPADTRRIDVHFEKGVAAGCWSRG